MHDRHTAPDTQPIETHNHPRPPMTSPQTGDSAPDQDAGVMLQPLSVKGYEELPLADIGQYPLLAVCHAAWCAARSEGRLPATVEPAVLPGEVMPYTMLLDYVPEKRDVRVRLAGQYVGERTSAENGGRHLTNFFNAHDADIVYASMEQVALTGQASLARRSYVSLEGSQLSYVRLILPLSLDGKTVTGFFKTIEPATLVKQPPA